MLRLKSTDRVAAGAMGRRRVRVPWAKSRGKQARRKQGGSKVAAAALWGGAECGKQELHGTRGRRELLPQKLKAPTVGLEPTTTRLRALRSAG